MIAYDPVILVNDLVRSQQVANALHNGIPNSRLLHVRDWKEPIGSVCLHYGLFEDLHNIMQANISAGVPNVLIDMGYYGRLDGETRWVGYHRYAVNSLHGPLVDWACSWDRIGKWVRDVITAERGSHILLVGMSAKAAQIYRMQEGEWDRWALSEINKYTERHVIYYPKPRSKHPRALPGTELWTGRTHDEADSSPKFNKAWCVVAHHSNLTVKAQAWGIPVICVDGIAKDLSVSFNEIDDPPLVLEEARRDFIARVGYQQYSISEMSSGVFWQHLLRVLM